MLMTETALVQGHWLKYADSHDDYVMVDTVGSEDATAVAELSIVGEQPILFEDAAALREFGEELIRLAEWVD